MTANGSTYEFGEFRFTPGENLLLRNGVPQPLSPKAIEVLALLVADCGHVVSKDELLQKIWNDVSVEESTVARIIWVLRDALGDDAKKHQFIQTVPKLGYRFVAEVRIKETDRSSLNVTSTPPRNDPGEPTDTGNRSSSFRGWSPQRTIFGLGLGGLLAASVITLLVFNVIPNSAFSEPVDRGTANDNAHQLYLQAMYMYDRRNLISAQRSVELFEQATEADPNFAEAWAGKGRAYRYLASIRDDSDVHDAYVKSRAAIDLALALDPNLSEAYSASCENKLFYEYDFVGAERQCKRAIDLKPNSSLAHEVYARFLTSRGRHDQALDESKKALDLDAKSLFVMRNLGVGLFYTRRYGEAAAQFRRVIEMDANFEATHRWLVVTLHMQGKTDEAFDFFMKARSKSEDPVVLRSYQTAFQEKGGRGFLFEHSNRIRGNYTRACLLAQLGDYDKALEFLEAAYQRREWGMAYLQVEPMLDPMRNDPRFMEFLKRIEK